MTFSYHQADPESSLVSVVESYSDKSDPQNAPSTVCVVVYHLVVLVVIVDVVDVFVVVVVVGATLDINFEANSSSTRVLIVTETAIGLFALISVNSSEPLSSQFVAMDLLKTIAFVII